MKIVHSYLILSFHCYGGATSLAWSINTSPHSEACVGFELGLSGELILKAGPAMIGIQTQVLMVASVTLHR